MSRHDTSKNARTAASAMELDENDLDIAAGLHIKMKSVLISSYSTGGSAGAAPAEEVSLNYEKVKWTYDEL